MVDDKLENPWLLKGLDGTGFMYVFNNPFSFTTQRRASPVKQKLKDLFIRKWTNDVTSSPKGFYYQHIKNYPRFNIYLSFLTRIYLPILNSLPRITTYQYRNWPLG